MVMVAGYLGLLPLLQSLAAEPAWPANPNASSVPVSVPYPMTAIDKTKFASQTDPKLVSKPKKRHTHRTAKPTHVTQRPSTSARPAVKPPKTSFSIPGGLASGDSQSVDTGASQTSGG